MQVYSPLTLCLPPASTARLSILLSLSAAGKLRALPEALGKLNIDCDFDRPLLLCDENRLATAGRAKE
jgi:hypothetical protein